MLRSHGGRTTKLSITISFLSARGDSIFSGKPRSMEYFLSPYARVSKEDIRRNRENVAARLGFLGRIVHGVIPRAWVKELRGRLGDTPDSAQPEA